MAGFLTDYSDAQIVAILIAGCLATAMVICLGTCGILYSLKAGFIFVHIMDVKVAKTIT